MPSCWSYCARRIVLLISRSLAGRPAPACRAHPHARGFRDGCHRLVIACGPTGDSFRRPWSDPYDPGISKPLDQPAAYFLLGEPLAYMARCCRHGRGSTRSPTSPCPSCRTATRPPHCPALKNPLPGGAWELHTRGEPIREPLLRRYGLRVDASSSCVEIEGAWLGPGRRPVGRRESDGRGKVRQAVQGRSNAPRKNGARPSKKIGRPLTFVAAKFLRSGIRFRFVLKIKICNPRSTVDDVALACGRTRGEFAEFRKSHHLSLGRPRDD